MSAPIELARELVLGAVEYAHGLGFAPHPDFEQARPHLGPWEGPSAITFGCDGRPHYINGPDDDPDRVLRTLRRTVGRKGFHAADPSGHGRRLRPGRCALARVGNRWRQPLVQGDGDRKRGSGRRPAGDPL